MRRPPLIPLCAALAALGGLLWAQGSEPTIDLGTGEEAYRIIARDPASELSFDDAEGMIYATGRTRIEYQGRALEARDIAINRHTGEAQAFGDVVLEGPRQRFDADSAWYNLRTEEGIGYNVVGWDGDVYFHGAEARRLSPEEMIFRRAAGNWDRLDTEEPEWVTPSYTTCEFPEPHVALRAREFDLYLGDRVFARRVIVEVMDVPVFYLPLWTKNLGRGNPWDVRFGYSSLLGAFVSVDYNYRHRLFEPDPVTGEMRRRSAGHLRAGVDYFSSRGVGYGAEYGYEFNDGAHRGRWQAYFIEDSDREDDGRWLVQGASRWEVSDDVVALIGADLVNDPEMYEDFFGDFDLDRGRVASRRVYGALTATDDDFVSRMSFDWRDRLSEDKFTNFSEPSDDNDNFRFDADGDGEDDIDEVFDNDRWGRVAERNEYTFSTNELQIGNLPVFYSWDVNAFANLDSGLNAQRTLDDSHVIGIDFYQSLLWTIHLTDRLTLLVRGGLGLAAVQRNDDDFGVGGPFPRRINNVIFADDGAFYVGTDLIGDDGLNDAVLDGTEGAFDTERLDLDDVDTAWVYGDIQTRLQARLTDALTAYAEWRLREASGQSIGEFYAEAGHPTFLEDLYGFRLEEHWIEVGLRHRLRRPEITSSIAYERNLQGNSEIFQGERIQRLSADAAWRNAARTLRVSVGGALEETQLRHPSDSREVELSSASIFANALAAPRSGLWFDNFSVSAFFPLDDDPFDTFDDDTLDNDLEEDDHNITVSNTLGVKISPVWDLLWRVRLTETESDDDDSFGANAETDIRLQRDLHDAVLVMGVGAKNEAFRGDGNTRDTRVDASVSIRFRRASEEPVGVARPVLVIPRGRADEIDETPGGGVQN